QAGANGALVYAKRRCPQPERAGPGCRIDTYRSQTLTPQLRRRGGPKEDAQIDLRPLVDVTSSPNTAALTQRGGSDRSALAPGKPPERSGGNGHPPSCQASSAASKS